MGQPKKKYDPHNQDSQDQDQKQANLQGQLQGQANLQGQLQGQGQGQGQGQAQGQAQLAVQSLDSKSDNKNDNGNLNWNANDNKSDNSNDNKNVNVNDNKLDNKVDNGVDNTIDNKVENTIDNKVNVDVNVNLDLKADGLSSPVIDLSHLQDNYGNAIVPQVVDQKLDGDGNQFNIQQVNNLVDNDFNVSSVNYDGKGGDFKMSAWADGGDVKMDSKIGDIAGNSASGVQAHADAAITQDAFTQTITQGANIQFNSITMSVAGHDLHDSHDLG